MFSPAFLTKCLAFVVLLVVAIPSTTWAGGENVDEKTAEKATPPTESEPAPPQDTEADDTNPPDNQNNASEEPVIVAVAKVNGEQPKAGPEQLDKEALEARLAEWRKVDWETLAEKDQLEFLRTLRKKCTTCSGRDRPLR